MSTVGSVALCDNRLCLAEDIARSDNENVLRKKSYFCMTCEKRHRVYYHKTTHTRYNTLSHFSHAPVYGADGGKSADFGPKKSTHETEEHIRGKYTLQQHVGSYHFVTKKCDNCDEHTTIQRGLDCGILIEERKYVDDERNFYVYDTILVNGLDNRPVCVMEVWNTHETHNDKILTTRALDIEFAEFTVEDLENCSVYLNRAPRLPGAPAVVVDSYQLTNLKPCLYTCDTCQLRKQIEEERNLIWEMKQREQKCIFKQKQAEKKLIFDQMQAELEMQRSQDQAQQKIIFDQMQTELEMQRSQDQAQQKIIFEQKQTELEMQRSEVQAQQNVISEKKRTELETQRLQQKAQNKFMQDKIQNDFKDKKTEREKIDIEKERVETAKKQRTTQLTSMTSEIELRCNQIAIDRNTMRITMENKIRNGQLYEIEQTTYNNLVRLEIDTDRTRMKYVMELYHLKKKLP